MGPTLRGLTVLDLSIGSLSASYASSLVSSWGAEVSKVERTPEGDPIRGYGPTMNLGGERTVSLPFLWTSGRKQWVGLRPGTDEGDRLVRALSDRADIVVASDMTTCEQFPGRKATVCVTAFGARGPRSHWKASSFGLFHAGGSGYVTPRAPQGGVAGEVKPVAPWGYIIEYFGGLYVAIAMLAAHLSRQTTGVIDISLQETVFPLMRREMAAWLYEGYVSSRHERLWKVAPSGFYASQDGPVYFNIIEDRDWHHLCILMGHPELKEDARFLTSELRFEHLEEMDEYLVGWAMQRSRAEIFEMCARVGVPAGPVNDPYDLLAATQLRSRGSLREFSIGNRTLTFPVPPIRPSEADGADRDWADVPPVGRDTEAVLVDVGFPEDEIRHAARSGNVFMDKQR